MNPQSRSIPVPVSLPADYIDRLDLLATGRADGNRSAMVRKLIDDATLCPQCGSSTRPDTDRPGVLYCDICQEPVIFTGQPADPDTEPTQ